VFIHGQSSGKCLAEAPNPDDLAREPVACSAREVAHSPEERSTGREKVGTGGRIHTEGNTVGGR